MIDLLKKIISSKYSLILLLIFIGITSKYILGNDNIVEQESEEIIEELTGVKVDLSPEDKEPQKDEMGFNWKSRHYYR